MDDNDAKTIETLEVLEALYDIYTRYPDDKFIAERVGRVSWTLSENPEFSDEGFFELSEGAGDESLGEYYESVIKRQLERLNKLREVKNEKSARAHEAYIAKLKEFSKEGYKVEAYYERVVNGKVEEGVSVVLARDTESKAITINVAVEEIRNMILESLVDTPKSGEPTQASMQRIAASLPPTIREYTLQRKRVVDSLDWLTENGITLD